jgi:localization factor PodJL
MEQHSVENLLRRLIDRIEENDRRYGRALDEVYARLDQLSHTTEAARVSAARDDSTTLDRLHDQVSKLAWRLEQEASSPLDDFERLGKALSGGMDHSAGASRLSASATEEFGASPYGSRPLLETPVGTEPPFSFWVPEPPYSPPPESPTAKFSSAGEDRDLDKRLIDVAHRLERSIETTMSTAVLEALNARLDEIGHQINQAFLRTPKFPSFEPLQVQISDLAQKLTRAEEQLARIGSIESELHGLIARVDASPSDVEEVIGRVAGEAARLAATEVKQSTAERLDVMHRDLMAMNDRTRANDERLTSSITAVQESLKQLAQQVEKSASQPAQPPRPRPAVDEIARGGAGRAELPQGEVDKPLHPLAEIRIDKGLARENANPEALARPKTLRTKLSAAPAMERAKATPAFERLKQLRPADEAFDLDTPTAKNPISDLGQDERFDTPADLIEAARRAAQAVARKEETHAIPARGVSVTAALNDTSTTARRPPIERRSLLIVAAAILLAISAALLYERLMSKPEPEILPPVIEQSAPAAETPPTQSDSWAPLHQPQEGPDKAASEGKTGNFTEISKSSYRSTTTEDTVQPEPVSLGQGAGVSLPPGIVFSIEDAGKSRVAPAETAPSAAPPEDPADAPEATNPELVARAQMLLNKLGYNAGTPDGQMDARTREAILSFERNNGLQETGSVTILLVTVLERLTS